MPQTVNAPEEASTRPVSTTFSDAGRFAPTANASGRGDDKEIRNDAPDFPGNTAHQFFVTPEDFIWLEISLVPEVESVFVQREDNAFDVLIIVNDRDEKLRDRIYDREAEIMDHLVEFDFSFRVLPRMGLPTSQLNVPPVAAYRRR